jgi:PQQ-dependent dehydrogenase (methanol/ethanol family)
MHRIGILFLAAACVWGQGRGGRREAPANPLAGQPDAIAAGEKLFAAACGGCHGATAEGGRGPNLADGRRLRRSSDTQLFQVIKVGVPGGDMPGFPLPDNQIWQVVSFIRSLSAPAAESPASGDVRAGEAIFTGKGGCGGCHRVLGRGGFTGPDLSNIGALRSRRQLRAALLDPASRSREGYEGITVVTKKGERIEGVARNRNNYSLQIAGRGGELHLLPMDEVKEMHLAPKSPMPTDLSTRLTAGEVTDLVAYLGSRSVRRNPSGAPPPLAADGVTFDAIKAGEGANWLTYGGDYASRRHSPLRQIDTGNVARLAPAWTYRMDQARRLESTPLVADGVMYVTDTNQVTALDARSGRRIWEYRDDEAARQSVNRGVALLGDRVFFITADAHLVALDRRNGGVLWHREYASVNQGYFATMAPVALRDRVIVGVGGGDSGMRGFVAALSATTGEELWRFWTIPARGEPGFETWSDFPLVEYGGAGTWMSGSYDPDLNLLYWTTGNPWPDMIGQVRKGDNLYSCSVVALDASTGKLRWHFQFTPHDTHDWDAQSIPVLVDLEFGGRPRKLLMHPNRNGFYYIVDRVTGEFLRATPFVDKLTWATGVDAKGRPIETGADPTTKGVLTCPSKRGASNWMSPSFNPATGLFYVPSLEQCDVYVAAAKTPPPMRGMSGGGTEPVRTDPGRFYLRALDPKTGARRWEYAMTGPSTAWTGTVSTGGGLVFFGDDDGSLVAVDAATGRHLWHYAMGQLLTASPMTYSVAGKQYVAIAAGSDVFAFALPD